jgi:hypothetical protein
MRHFDENDMLIRVSIIADLDNKRCAVCTSEEAIVKAIAELAEQGILYHETMIALPKSNQVHRRDIMPVLQWIKNTWFNDNKRVAYYNWLIAERDNARIERQARELAKAKIDEFNRQWTSDKRERYEDELNRG